MITARVGTIQVEVVDTNDGRAMIRPIEQPGVGITARYWYNQVEVPALWLADVTQVEDERPLPFDYASDYAPQQKEDER